MMHFASVNIFELLAVERLRMKGSCRTHQHFLGRRRFTNFWEIFEKFVLKSAIEIYFRVLFLKALVNCQENKFRALYFGHLLPHKCIIRFTNIQLDVYTRPRHCIVQT